jgi:hypothetical protein
MKQPNLVLGKSASQKYFHFRSCVLKDLFPIFGARKKFQVSLKNVRNGETGLVSTSLITLTEQ